MTALDKAFKIYRKLMIIFGTLLGIFLFTVTFIYGGHEILDSLGVSLLGFALPLTVYAKDHELKK